MSTTNINGKWKKVPGSLKQVSVGSRGYIWGVDSADNISHAVGGNDFWGQVDGRLFWVSVGADGTVWGVQSPNKIYRWDGKKWTNIPGSLVHISVGNSENIWGVNDAGKIFRWNGSDWQNISGTLSNISVAADGTVWGVNSSGNIFYFLAEEPLEISNPKLDETKLEPNETATYSFDIKNATTGVKLTNIILTLQYDEKYFGQNGITIPEKTIIYPDLDPGSTSNVKFVINTYNATVGPYGIYGVNGSYQMQVVAPTVNVSSVGGWMSFQVEPD